MVRSQVRLIRLRFQFFLAHFNVLFILQFDSVGLGLLAKLLAIRLQPTILLEFENSVRQLSFVSLISCGVSQLKCSLNQKASKGKTQAQMPTHIRTYVQTTV